MGAASDESRLIPTTVAWFFGLLAIAFPAVAAADESRPNVLFIAIDDLNDWTGGLAGHPQAKTPHLDRLAERGILFADAHCNAPLCNASRASLMTGIRPSTSGVYSNRHPWRRSPVLADAVTLPQHFAAAGYQAVGTGKIYHGRYPDPASWHTYFPSMKQNRPGDPRPDKRFSGLNRGHFDWGPLQVEDAAMGDAMVVDWAADFLTKQHEKPFFLAAGIFRPHLPWYVPQSYFDRFPVDEIVLPKVIQEDLADIPPAGVRIARPGGDHAAVVRHNQWKHAVQGYLASIAFADAMLGRLIDALDASPHAENTIVVLWSDHGWHLGEKEHWRKFALWEEATQVPLAIIAPGVTKPGSRCERPVSLLDIYPTLVELAGLPPREELEGRSLVPFLEAPQRASERPVICTFGHNNHAVISARYRYIRYAGGGEELYDRREDPREWTNLAERPEMQEIKSELAQWLPKTNRKDAPRENTQSGKGNDNRKERKQAGKKKQSKTKSPKEKQAAKK